MQPGGCRCWRGQRIWQRDWFDESAAELVTTLRAADPSGPCPNFNPGSPETNEFWIRRQVHETLVHCYDLERALADPTPIPAVIAADGVDEYLDVFVRTRGKQTLTGPLRLSSTDHRIGTDHVDLTLTGDPAVAASFRDPG